jgi:hypothetical protein
MLMLFKIRDDPELADLFYSAFAKRVHYLFHLGDTVGKF